MEESMVDREYCMSSFLMYRRVVDPQKEFAKGYTPKTVPLSWDKVPISDSIALETHLRKMMAEFTKDGRAALALSGGIDSAVLAKMMPKGSIAYTFKCIADGIDVVDETQQAKKYAEECELEHRVVEIAWSDVERVAPLLMKHKNAPMHSIEAQIYLGGIQAKSDGFTRMIYGETADVNYGGLSNVLSREWHLGEFIERYAYLKPWLVLNNPKVDFAPFLEYEKDGFIDVHQYLCRFDIIESINSYVNACEVAEIEFAAPFANSYLEVPLDTRRIRHGENKYLIREIFERLYPGWDIPVKIPMPRPVDEWFKEWKGPQRKEFIPNCVEILNGDQKWLVWALETYLDICDSLN